MSAACRSSFLGRYLRLTRRGVVLVERSFQRQKAEQASRVVLMPMVHVAERDFFASTLRSPRFAAFDLVLHEGPPPGCTSDPSPPRWRFIDSVRGASPSALLLELSWLVFIGTPMAASNALCRCARAEPLELQPEPLCPVEGSCRPRFVATDSTGVGETLLAMASMGRSDPRARRLLLTLAEALAGRGAEVAVPWGIGHMSYLERGLLELGFEESAGEAREHVACGWGTFVCAHLFIYTWWWALHAATDAWLLWRAEGRVAIRMPLFWLWGATLHIGPAAVQDTQPSGPRSLIPPEGALQEWWRR